MAGIKFDFTADNKNLLNSAKQAQTGVINAISGIERAGRGVESTFSKIKGSVLGGFADIAKGMAGLTVLLQSGNFIKTLIDDAAKFNVAMKEVSTLSEDVANHLEQYKEKVVNMTTEIPISATEAAKALYQIESAGHHGADGLNVLKESAKGAIGGVTDTATTADAITTILNAYKMESSEAQHVSDLLFTTVRLGKTNMSQLGSTIAQVAPVAASFGVSIEDVLAAIASLTKQGTKTSVAVRQVRDAITATTKSMGDNAFKGRSFLDAMDEVAQKAQGSNNALRQDLGTLQALNAVLSLTGKNSKAARQDVEDIKKSSGAAEAAYKKMASTAGTEITLLRNNVFQAILPMAEDIKSMSGEIAHSMNVAFDSGAMDKALVSLEAFIAAYATYRGLLAATTAWNTAALGGTYQLQIAELQKLIPLKELDGQADLQAAVAKGTLTTEQAKLVASLRAETESRYEEIMAAETQARADLKALTTAEISAQANVVAAEEMVAAAQARVTAAIQSGSASEIEAAQEELNTASRLKNTAVTELNTIQRQKNGAATMVTITSKNADTAATLMNTAGQGANTVSTGILATAKLSLSRAIQAVNASFLASPLFWIGATIAAVTYGVYKMVTAETAHEAAIRKTNEALEEQKKKLDERRATIDGLIRTIQDENSTEYQKVKAYDELKKIAPDITEAYSKEALATMEAADAQKMLNQSMDEAEYDELVKKVREAEKAYNDAKAASEAVASNRKYTATQFGNIDQGGIFADKRLKEAEEQLKIYRKQLDEVIRLKREAEEEARPIEIRLKEAKENEAAKQSIADFYDQVMEKVSEIQSENDKLNFDEAQKMLDAYIAQIESEVNDLHIKIEKNPLNQKLQVEEQEKMSVLNNLIKWKNSMINGGFTTIPLSFHVDWQSAQNALMVAKAHHANIANVAQQTVEAGLKAAKQTLLPASSTPKQTHHASGGGSTPKQTHHASGGGSTFDPKEAKAKNEEMMIDWMEELEDLVKDMVQQHTDNEVEIMDASTEKVLSKIKEDKKKELEEYKKQEEELIKKRKELEKKRWQNNNPKKKEYEYKEISDTEARRLIEEDAKSKGIASPFEQINILRNDTLKKYAKEEEEAQREIIQSMRDYLKEYGTLEQQRLAITQEYDEKIAKAQNEGERLKYEAEKKSVLSSLNAQSLAMDIDWSKQFPIIGNIVQDLARETLDKVEEYMETDDYKRLSPKDKESYVNLRNQLKGSLPQDTSNPFKPSTWNDLENSVKKYQDSVKKVVNAQQRHQEAVDKLGYVQQIANQAATDSQKAMAEAWVKAAEEEVDETKKKLEDAQNEKNDAGEEVEDKAVAVAKGLDTFGEALSQITSGSLFGFANGVVKMLGLIKGSADSASKGLAGLGKVGGWIGAILQLIDALGEDPGGTIEGIIDKIFNVIEGIFEQLNSGEFVGEVVGSVINGVVNLITQVFENLASDLMSTFKGEAADSFTGIFKNIGSKLGLRDEKKSKLDLLKEEAELLRKSIDNLSKKMDRLSDISEITNATDIALKQQQSLNENLKEQLKEQMYHSDHHHSFDYYWKEFGGYSPLTQKGLEKYSKTIGRSWNGDLLDLSPDEMLALLADSDFVELVKGTGKGGYGERVLEKMQEYADEAYKIQDLVDQLSEKITGISFDSLFDSFSSQIANMDSSAEDFANNFEDYMKNAIIQSMMTDLFKEKLKNWHEAFRDRMQSEDPLNRGSNMTQDEMEELLNKGGLYVDTLTGEFKEFESWNSIVDEALKQRDALKDMFGFTSDTERQQATAGGWEKMGQDTAEELNGRFTALQIAGESINTNTFLIQQNVAQILLLSTGRTELITGIREQLVNANSYLEDMVRYAKATYKDFGRKIDTINQHQENIYNVLRKA